LVIFGNLSQKNKNLAPLKIYRKKSYVRVMQMAEYLCTSGKLQADRKKIYSNNIIGYFKLSEMFPKVSLNPGIISDAVSIKFNIL
jgi:hypothetical protein